jgi:hypothetical protein
MHVFIMERAHKKKWTSLYRKGKIKIEVCTIGDKLIKCIEDRIIRQRDENRPKR